MGEPYIDKNADGVRDADEEFVNYPNPGLSTGGSFDVADGLYSGINCAHTTLCSSDQSVFISKTLTITNFSDTIFVYRVMGAGPFTLAGALNNPVDIKVDFPDFDTYFS